MGHRKKGPKPKWYNTEYVTKAASETVLAQEVMLGEWSEDNNLKKSEGMI